jgi:pilus assembly protein CpaB
MLFKWETTKMKTKTVVAILAVLGIVAALSTAVLAASFRIEPVKEIITVAPSETTLLIASRDVEAMSVLDLEAITEKTVLVKDAPNGHYSDSVQVVGRVLVADMVKGQPYRMSSFAKDGSGTHLAGKLNRNTRAMTVRLNDAQGLGGLVYPGSKVDILVSFSVAVKGSRGEAVSTTLLESITVLAVDSETVSDPTGAEEAAAARQSNKSLMITLLVDTRQAEALQLASLYGRMSLTLRNPQDLDPVDDSATLLSGGEIARLATTMGVSVPDEQTLTSTTDANTGEIVLEKPSPKNPPGLAIELYKGSSPVVSVQLTGANQ